MKTLNRITLGAAGALLSGMMNCTAALAETEGTLHFSGAIIENVCLLEQQRDSAYASCRATDGTTLTAPVTISATTSGFLPADKGITHVQWMNDTRTVGVVTAQYH